MTGFSPLSRARAYASLARWLGPWAGDERRPDTVRCERISIAGARDRHFGAHLYTPTHTRADGAYVIAPGLHYAGPDDPRMDRFCRVLAASGVLVLAPFLPDYTSLRVAPSAFDDFDATFEAMLACDELPHGCKPGVFSISFGSLLALHLAGGPRRAHQVGSLIVFGGYADWGDTIRFCLTGEIDGRVHGARDPLNQPVVFMNLIEDIDIAPGDPAPLLDAWTEYVRAVWGRQIMKVDGRHAIVARRMARDVPAACRELFLIGCGAEPGGLEVCTAALARAAQRTAFLDPAPYCRTIECDVHLVHGIDDDVIPYVQSPRLAELLPDSVTKRVHLTGLYGHTSQAGGSAFAAVSELWTMSRILAAFVGGGRRRTLA